MATSMFRKSNFYKSVKLVRLRHKRQVQSLVTQDQNDIDAHYPPIKPKFPPGKWGEMDRKIAWGWHEQQEDVAALTTAKDKIKHLTEKKCSVWKYNCIDTTPNLLDYQCKVTKTHIIDGALPVLYNVGAEDGFDEQLKKIVIDTLIQEHELNRFRFDNKIIVKDIYKLGSARNTHDYQHTNILLRSILTNLLGILSGQRKDILECHVDSNVKVSACWSRDGVLRSKLRTKPKDKNFIRQNNSLFHGEHTVDYQIRKNKPLPQFVPVSDELCHALSYSDMPDYSPRGFGQFKGTIPRRITAGYNLGDRQEFNHLSIILLNNPQLLRMNSYGEEYKTMADKGYAMGTGFLSTVAQAHMQGFNQYEELTYPFTSQTLLTDGKHFVLSAYQLNTLQLWKDDSANDLQNLCWISKNEKLYETFDSGKIVGFNDKLFKKLLKFFLIEPCDRNGIDLSPNLKEPSEPVDIPDRKVYEVAEEDFHYDRS